MSELDEKWEKAKAAGAQTHDGAHFTKGNPGGGRHKVEAVPMTFEEVKAREAEAWGALWYLAVVKKQSGPLQRLLAYLAGMPPQTIKHERTVKVEGLSDGALERLLLAAARVRELDAGKTLKLPAGVVLEGAAVEIVDDGEDDVEERDCIEVTDLGPLAAMCGKEPVPPGEAPDASFLDDELRPMPEQIVEIRGMSPEELEGLLEEEETEDVQ